MLDPRSLYQFLPAAQEFMGDGEPHALIHLLTGYVDAGHVPQVLTEYLLQHCESEVLVRFDHDQLHDYRSRRPAVTLHGNRFTALDPGRELTLWRLRDLSGASFLLLAGPEPDTQWQRTDAALHQIIERLNITTVVSAIGAPMPVPHSRPTTVSVVSEDPSRQTSAALTDDPLEFPASFDVAFQHGLAEQGVAAWMYVAHVPHYLTQAPFMQATLAVAEQLNTDLDLQLPLGHLRDDVTDNLIAVNAELNVTPEAQEVVQRLEDRHDRLHDEGIEDETDLPSADDIAQEFEQFLRERDGD